MTDLHKAAALVLLCVLASAVTSGIVARSMCAAQLTGLDHRMTELRDAVVATGAAVNAATAAVTALHVEAGNLKTDLEHERADRLAAEHAMMQGGR